MSDVLSLAQEDTHLRKKSYSEYAGSCPGCGGNDRFCVRYDRDRSRWMFMCRNCWDAQQYVAEKGRKRGWGDTIDYLRHFRGMSFTSAQAMSDGQDVSPVEHTPERYMSDEWQTAARQAMEGHTARLWNEKDTLALDYARSRGLLDATIKQFQLGYSLKDSIPRLTIPVINDGHYAAIYRRDLRPDVPHEERWRDAPGGTKNELYLADSLYRRVDIPVVLCEDAFSALSLWQECSDLVNVVATGSADCGMKTRWLARLACMPLVLVALDADEAGDKHSKEWLARLPNARRLRPLLKDPNDMLMDGWDLRGWVVQTLDEEESIFCTTCGMDAVTAPEDVIFQISDEGRFYCPECWNHQFLNSSETG